LGVGHRANACVAVLVNIVEVDHSAARNGHTACLTGREAGSFI
jgi:hypothetical protein